MYARYALFRRPSLAMLVMRMAAVSVAAFAAGMLVSMTAAWFRPGGAVLVALLVLAKYAAILAALGRARVLDRLEKAVERDPTRPELHFELAEARLARGRFEEAVRAFRNGLGVHPGLDILRPATVLREVLARPELSPTRRRVLSRLLIFSIYDHWQEEDERMSLGFAPPAGRKMTPAPETPPFGPDDVEGRVFGRRLRDMAESIRIEIKGLEQLIGELHAFMDAAEAERERAVLTREVERLRARLRMIDGKAGAFDSGPPGGADD